MFDKRKEKELQALTPAAIEENRKQHSLNRVFGLLAGIAALLVAMLVYEIVLMIIH